MALPAVPFNPELDLKLERVVPVPRELVWAAWTEPRHLVEWFTPRPWTLAEVEIDLQPGGKFRTVMRSPEGQLFPGDGCLLEVTPHQRLIWTSMLIQGYRPAASAEGDLPMTAIIDLASVEGGTRYTAMVLHRDKACREQHEAMGFYAGWGKALDQLVEHMQTMM